MFENLKIENWRQFSKLDIDFHPRLTVLTGVNGSGKTTVLNVLSECLGWKPVFVSSFNEQGNGKRKYGVSINNEQIATISRDVPDGYYSFGELKTKQNAERNELITFEDYAQKGTYSIHLNPEIEMKGVFIQSHRPTFPYRELKTIPTSVATRKQIYDRYHDFSISFARDEPRYSQVRDDSKYSNERDNSQFTYGTLQFISATYLIKQDLASLAIFGYGSSAVAPIPNAKALFEGYCKILESVLPQTLGFKRITVAMPEVIIETSTGNFPLDGISGGISSIIDITWQLYMFAEPGEPFVALIDEPENHLHPELQKSILGNLINTFPHVQFVVATHNPLIISSQKDSHIYVLDYKDNKVHSTLLDHINRAGTSSTILRDVLGLDTTIPLWAEEALNATIDKYRNISLSSDNLSRLRAELEQAGLQDYAPDAIAKVIEGDMESK
ncbi:MAG: AAA family ATPase [Defluviitaleaceae bacterium]|nr:AAA family ATPase [Defluviitaleaceae bacterium]